MNQVTPKNLIAISGSTRTSSSNLVLIKAIAALTSNQFNISIYNDIASLPHFNPDMENPAAPEAVTDFRNRLRRADAILICTPEYAMGVPGSLKNAIDWTVSSCEFSKKPTALITASSLGHKGHESLKGTLNIIEANITEDTQLVISYIKTKLGGDGTIADKQTLKQVTDVMNALYDLTTAKVDGDQ